MKRFATALLVLAGVSLLCVSCQNEPGPVAPPGTDASPSATPPVVADKGEVGTTGYCRVALHNLLAEHWNTTEDLVFTLLRQTVDVTQDNVLTFLPSGWPSQYAIVLNIPAGRVIKSSRTPNWPLVTFTVGVPVAGPPDILSVPYFFGPDGLRFNSPGINVSFPWPPWATPQVFGYSVMHLYQEWHEGQIHYAYEGNRYLLPGGQASIPPAPPEGAVDWTIYTTGITADIDHFSRWQVTEGDGGKLPPFSSLINDRCWVTFEPPPPDPLEPIRLDF